MMAKLKIVLAAMFTSSATFATSVNVTTPGEYASSGDGMEFVVSGSIAGDVSISATNDGCCVSLSGATLDGVLTIIGDAALRLSGANSISTTEASAISCSGALSISGDGSLDATAAGGKKTGVIAASDLAVAGGTTVLTIANPTVKNACGVSLSGNYVQTDGMLKIVGASGDYKQNGVFLASKKRTATISGGTLDVTLAGVKSVGLALDKASSSGLFEGGTMKFAMSGDGAKGVKGDGSFTMTGGTLVATLTGGVAEDLFEYEDGDGNTWNYYVALTSSTKTSGGTSVYNTTSLINSGTYPVMDPAKCYAVKVGTLSISGGTVAISSTGTAGRGLGADSMTLSGGTYDITVSGGPTDVYVESLVDSGDLDDTTFANGVTTCLDSGGAACLKTGDDAGTLEISGGTFNLKATGNAGKLVNAAGYLVIGTEGQTTLPTDSSFSPDISGSTTGAKVFCTAVKHKYYGSLATAVATTDISGQTLSVASDNLVTSSSSSGGNGAGGGTPPSGEFGGGTPPSGGGEAPGGGDAADYSNPKGIKAVAGVTVHGGRISVTTAKDGGEGLESKALLTINGGVLDLQCYDDAINSGGNLVINGGYIYAGSSGNDAIDSNGKIYMSGGVVLAMSSAGAPEVGIDTDDSSGLVINGGHLVAVGGASGNMVVGSSGSQKTYKKTSASASTYSGKYLALEGDQVFTVKMPALSGSVSLVCSTEGWTTAGIPVVSSSAPSAGDIKFHNVYLSTYEEEEDEATSSVFWPGDGAYDSSAARVYDGVIFAADGSLAATIRVKAAKISSSTATFPVTATVKDASGKSWSYKNGSGISSGKIAGLTCSASAAPVSSFGVTLGANGMTGSWGGLEIQGARYGMATANDAMKTALETCWKKSFTVAATNESGATRLQIYPGNGGTTKISGFTAGGFAVSLSVRAIQGESALYVPAIATLKSGSATERLNLLAAVSTDGEVSLLASSVGALSSGGATSREVEVLEYDDCDVSQAGESYSGHVVLPDLVYPAKFAASGLPAGLKINASTGEIYGTPTKPGTYTATVTVTSGIDSKAKAVVAVPFEIANYADKVIPVSDAYGDMRVGVKTYIELSDCAAGCTVSGLPAGLKFATKATKDATYGFGTVPAYTIYGVPTKAVTNTVYFKKSLKEANAAGKTVSVSHQASATFRVDALDSWAQGTFNGVVTKGEDEPSAAGLVQSIAVTAAGKGSGKFLVDGLTWTVSSAAYDSYDADSATYSATVVGKSGKLAFTNEMAVFAAEVDGSVRGIASSKDGTWMAWKNLWNADPWKTAAKSFANKTLALSGTGDGLPAAGDTITLKFTSSGAVTAAGKFIRANAKDESKTVTVSSSSSSVLVPVGGNAFSVFVYFAPKSTATVEFGGFAAEIPLLWNGGSFELSASASE